jgi:hypothetical protein
MTFLIQNPLLDDFFFLIQHPFAKSSTGFSHGLTDGSVRIIAPTIALNAQNARLTDGTPKRHTRNQPKCTCAACKRTMKFM